MTFPRTYSDDTPTEYGDGLSLSIEDHVKFVGPDRKVHNALVTAVHGGDLPSINLVYVSDNPEARDPNGRQLAERQTSVCHQANQGAPGNYWVEA